LVQVAQGAFKAARAGSDGLDMSDRWIHFEAKYDGVPYMANVRHPLAELRNPEYEHHVLVTLHYAAHWRTGLPKPNALPRLQDFEDRVISHLDGHGMLAGSETGDARRRVHLYIRGGGSVLDLFRRMEARGKHKGVEVAVTHDPEWRSVEHLAALSARHAA
jgi:hypothetical protein